MEKETPFKKKRLDMYWDWLEMYVNFEELSSSSAPDPDIELVTAVDHGKNCALCLL